MIRALDNAATGLQAMQDKISQISNDLANVNTNGYKRGRTEFDDLLYENKKEPGGALGAVSSSPVGIQLGSGVKTQGVYKTHEQGPAINTRDDHDLMIEGKGFFPVQKANGETAYTRTGSFKRSANGVLQTSFGAMLLPQITVPSNSLGMRVTEEGSVKALMPDNQEIELGQIQLATFVNDQGLLAEGNGLYRPTPASGAAVLGIPGENGLGGVAQGFLEGSNVNIANTMVDMINTQRAFELNSKALETASQMLGNIANIKP